MPNYRRYYLAGHAVFVTVVTHERDPWLNDATNLRALLESMRRVKRLYPFRHVAHVILPDHFHWLFVPRESSAWSRIVGAVKRDVTWRMKERGSCHERLWQNRFYDHVVRDEHDFGRHLDYIHYNPVKHGHCHAAGEYANSSFLAWVKRGVYPPEWGVSTSPPRHLHDMDLD